MNARKWVGYSLVSLAGLAIFGAGASAQKPAAADKPAAIVDGVAISMAEVDALIKQAGPMATTPTEGQHRQMQHDAVNMLIDDLLMQQFLKKNAPKIEPAEVNKRLTELDEAMKKQGKTRQDFYKETGLTEEQLRTNIVTGLQWAGFVKERLTDADLKRYYNENREFFDRVAVRASHIVMRIPPSASETDRQAILTKLQGLRQEILAGKIDFAEAAKKYSQCTSAPNGGDIGYFQRKFIVDEAFAKVAFALKVGDISDVVQTEFGMHLIKVTDRKPGQPSEFETIKELVRETCVNEMRMGLLEEQRKTAHVQIILP
jgi:parvulin-like peptidyl-prolyl isomerase